MLVLTRKQQQKIQIGENITVTILRVKGSVVRLGIEAPDDVRILRSELACVQMDDRLPSDDTTAVEESAEADPRMQPSHRPLPACNPSTRGVLERMLATC